MKYPQRFIKNVKKKFPNYSDLHKALDDGDVSATVTHLLNIEREL